MSEAERRHADTGYVGAAPHPVTSTSSSPPTGTDAGGRGAGFSAVSQRGTSRRIGEILVSHGFASEQELDDAVSEQERTGQPLGQILVQNGVITRLELASALAEQWADQSTAALGAAHPPPERLDPPHGDEDERYAERLEEAVGELTRRLNGSEANGDRGTRFTDLTSRLEATVARAQRIEATVATLSERLEGVAGGVDETFAALHAGLSGLALDLARIDAAVAEIGSTDTVTSAPDPALAEGLAGLRAEVRDLADRPVVDEAARDRFDRMAARLDELARTTARGDVDEAVNRLAARVEVLAGESAPAAELEAQARLIAELRAALEALAKRPDLHRALDVRLGRLETELANGGGRSDTVAVAALAERLEAASGAQEALVTGIAGLGARVEELAERLAATAAAQEGLTVSIDDQGASFEAVAARLEATTATRSDLTAAIDEHGARVDTLAERLDATTGTHSDLTAAIEAHGARVDTLAERLDATTGTHSDLTATIDNHGAHVEALARRVDDVAKRLDATAGTHNDLTAAITHHGADIDALAQRLEATTTTHADLTDAIGEHGARVDGLTQRLDATATTQNDLTTSLDRLASRVEELAVRQLEPHASSSIEPVVQRLVEMEQGLRSIREETASLPAAALSKRLEEVEARVDALPAGPARDEVTAATLAELEARLCSELVTADELGRALAGLESAAPESDGLLDALADDVAGLRLEVSEITQFEARRPNQPTMQQVEQIVGKLAALETRIAHDAVGNAGLAHALAELRAELAAEHTVSSPGIEELRVSVDTVATRLVRLESLAVRVESLAAAVEGAAPAPPVPTPAELREEIAAQVAELGRTLAERRATEPASDPAADGRPADLEQTLERTRMALERIGLHLGEHDRALAELMRTRVVTQRLDELAARIDDLAAAAPAVRRVVDAGAPAGEAPVGMQALINRIADVEQSYERDRERLMTRLERMASALDWRLQRLENGDTA